MQDMIVIVEPMIPALRRYAMVLLRDQGVADDLVQDCLERAISGWHRRRPDGNPRTWVFTILHNLAISRLRQRARRPAHVALDATDPALLCHDAVQEDGLRQRDILAALDLLSEEHRQLLLLISVEGLSYAEAAKILAVPLGTIMSRLSRARERLRMIFEDGAVVATLPRLRRVK